MKHDVLQVNRLFLNQRLAVLFFWAACCFSAQAQDDLLADLAPEISGLEFIERFSYPEKALGYSVRYQKGEFIKIDVYVYDKGLANLKEGIDSPEAIDEMKSVGDVIFQIEALGKYRDVTLIKEGEQKFEEQNITFLWSRYSYNQPVELGGNYDGTRISDSYLTIHRGNFVKVRVTVKESELNSLQKDVDQFMLTLAKLISEDKK